MKPIGKTFPNELFAAGLGGLPFSYGEDGAFLFEDSITQEQKDAVLAVYAAHDPQKQVVPEEVTMRQARLALEQAGILANVDAAIESLESPHKEAARIEWEYSQSVQRHKGLVSMMASSLGLSESEVDQLFITAAKL